MVRFWDGQIFRFSDFQMNRRTDFQMNRWTDFQMDRYTLYSYTEIKVLTYWQIDRLIFEWLIEDRNPTMSAENLRTKVAPFCGFSIVRMEDSSMQQQECSSGMAIPGQTTYKWPVKHGREFLVPCKKWHVQYKRTLTYTGQVTFYKVPEFNTAMYKRSPCIYGLFFFLDFTPVAEIPKSG